MKNTTFFKVSSGLVAGFAVLSLAVPAQAAYYYDQTGRAIYYDTYTVPAGQYYLAQNYNYGYGVGYANTYNNFGYAGNAYYPNDGYNTPPSIYSTPFTEVRAGETYVSGTNALDREHDPLFYSLISGPAGMTVNPQSGFIRWENTAGKGGQSFPVTVGVTDNRSPMVTKSFTITVTGASSASASSVATGSTGASATNGTTSGNTKYTSSVFNAIFGSSKNAPGIVISNVNVTSGPKNINDNSDQNCESFVSWTTNVGTAGQVVYGTASQQSVANYAYPLTATEGNTYTKQHQVKLGCLANMTHFFRVVAFSATDRAVSDEYTIFPVVIRTQIPQTGGTVFTGSASGSTAGIGGLLLRLITHPIFLIILFVAAVWYMGRTILYRINNKAKLEKEKQAAHAPAHADPHGAHGADPHAQIPMLAVPHH